MEECCVTVTTKENFEPAGKTTTLGKYIVHQTKNMEGRDHRIYSSSPVCFEATKLKILKIARSPPRPSEVDGSAAISAGALTDVVVVVALSAEVGDVAVLHVHARHPGSAGRFILQAQSRDVRPAVKPIVTPVLGLIVRRDGGVKDGDLARHGDDGCRGRLIALHENAPAGRASEGRNVVAPVGMAEVGIALSYCFCYLLANITRDSGTNTNLFEPDSNNSNQIRTISAEYVCLI